MMPDNPSGSPPTPPEDLMPHCPECGVRLSWLMFQFGTPKEVRPCTFYACPTNYLPPDGEMCSALRWWRDKMGGGDMKVKVVVHVDDEAAAETEVEVGEAGFRIPSEDEIMSGLEEEEEDATGKQR